MKKLKLEWSTDFCTVLSPRFILFWIWMWHKYFMNSGRSSNLFCFDDSSKTPFYGGQHLSASIYDIWCCGNAGKVVSRLFCLYLNIEHPLFLCLWYWSGCQNTSQVFSKDFRKNLWNIFTLKGLTPISGDLHQEM